MDPSTLFLGATTKKPIQVASTGNEVLENLPIGERSNVQKERIKENDKQWFAKRDEIYSYTPSNISSSNGNLKELDGIASKYSNVFGLMQKSGLIAGIQSAAEKGIQGGVGQYTASIGLPVKEFLKNNNLSPDERNAFNRAVQILGTEFLNNVKTNRGLLGINPTDNDARLLQAPMSTVDDTAKSVQFWIRQQLLTNYQRQDLYKSLVEHDKKVGKTADPSSFFDPNNTAYTGILDTYSNRRQMLQKQFGPTAQ
jgi:hypothetical protein